MENMLIVTRTGTGLRAGPAFVAKALQRSRQRYRPPPPKQLRLRRPDTQAGTCPYDINLLGP